MMNFVDTLGHVKTALASIVSAAAGTFVFSITVDIALQRVAWTVAIIAGVISAANGIKSLCKPKKSKDEE